MTEACAISMYSLQHLYTNKWKQNAVNVNEEPTAMKERRKERNKNERQER
jgi:hypothetical protein